MVSSCILFFHGKGVKESRKKWHLKLVQDQDLHVTESEEPSTYSYEGAHFIKDVHLY